MAKSYKFSALITLEIG